MKEIFLNHHNRLRCGWRFLVYCLLYIFIYQIFAHFIATISQILTGDSKEFFRGASGIMLNSAVAFLVATGLGWFCGKVLEDLPLKALGWVFNRTWLKDYLFGLILGVLSITVAVLLAIPVGGISLMRNQAAPASSIWWTFVTSFCLFFIAAAFEEVLFRGYILQTFIRSKLAWLGILLTSIPFALIHLGNNNATWFSTLNTALAGFWFGVAYLKTRSLWLVFGLHLAWNWFQGAFFGITVSGTTNLAPDPIFLAIDQGPSWLTGGHYGIEGGITCTISMIISTVLIWFLPFLKPTDDMLVLSSQENPKYL